MISPAKSIMNVNNVHGLQTFFNQPWKSNNLIIRELGPTQDSCLYADGSIIKLQTETVYRLIHSNNPIQITREQFQELIEQNKRKFAADSQLYKTNPLPSDRGLDIIFSVSSPPPGAMDAFATVESYLENLFTDPIYVYITVGFDHMGGSGPLGWTSSEYAGYVSWTNTRSGLIADMDSDDEIQDWLPTGSWCPVRYNYDSGTASYENRCYFTIANYRAAIGTVSGDAAHMEFNLDFSWDYDPSDGVSYNKFCFQSVLAHEVGHALGFTSGAEYRSYDIEALDIYRFQRSDGDGDFNPDTLEEFQTTGRLVDKDEDGTRTNDENSDLISVEYRMSDGTPYQCSHFAPSVYGIMRPAISQGYTFYPNFYKTPDIRMFDAIGWDYYETPYYTLATIVEGEGMITRDPDLPSYEEGTIVTITAEPTEDFWCFSNWSGDVESTSAVEHILMDSDKEVIAHFYDGCPWDVNDDGIVDPVDVGFIKYFYGQDPSSPIYEMFDVNDDGVIDPVDVGLTKYYYGPCPSCN